MGHMTNIFKDDSKRWRKLRLFQIGVESLESQGWRVTKERGLGKASVRRISKGSESMLVSIRTTQDRWLAFPPKPNGKGWITLDDVDVVIAVSVDDMNDPSEAWVHWIPATEMLARFDAGFRARKSQGRVQPKRRGVWIPLYHRESESENVSYVGGGAGLDFPPIARIPLGLEGSATSAAEDESDEDAGRPDESTGARGLTIAEAKRGLSLTFGVPESAITITVEA
jgi:hypothetical protein